MSEYGRPSGDPTRNIAQKDNQAEQAKKPREQVSEYLAFLGQLDLMGELPPNVNAGHLQSLVLNYDITPEDRKVILRAAKHPDILKGLPAVEKKSIDRVSEFPQDLSRENQDLLETPMTQEELRDFFPRFVELLRNPKSATGVTFVEGKHPTDPRVRIETVKKIFPNADRYKQKVTKLLNGRKIPSMNSMLSDAQGEATYVDESLSEKQLRFFQTVTPDQIENLLSNGTLSLFSMFSGEILGRVTDAGFAYVAESNKRIYDLVGDGHPRAMEIHFQDTYFHTQVPKIDVQGLFCETSYRPFKCLKLDMAIGRGNSMDPMKRSCDLRILTILGSTEGIYKSIKKPDDEQNRNGKYDEYFELIRAMKTNPAFLVEALHEAFPEAFVGSKITGEKYYDPEKNSQEIIPVKMYNRGAKGEFQKNIGGNYTPAKHSSWKKR